MEVQCARKDCIDGIKDDIKEIRSDVKQLLVDNSAMKVKVKINAGIWGAFTGSIVSIIGILSIMFGGK